MSPGQLTRAAWQRLGPAALGYRSMTDKLGLPTPRARRTLLTRVLEPETKHALETSSSIDDPAVIAAVQREVERYRERLEKVALWHRALRRAFLELPGERRFFKDPVESLFAPAWDASGEDEPADEAGRVERARRIIADLAVAAPPFSLLEIDRLLADPAVVSDLESRVQAAWASRPQTATALTALNEAAGALGAVLVPVHGSIPSEATGPWQAVLAETAQNAVVRARALGLSQHDGGVPPALVSDDTWDGEGWIAPFRALDASVRERVARILSNPPHPWPEALTASSGMRLAVETSAAPLALGTIESRAVFAVAAQAYQAVGVSRFESNVATPGAQAYLAACWRRSDGVTAALSRGYGGVLSTLVDFVANPLDFVFGRLWIRLSRTDFDGHRPSSVDDVWEHLKQAVVSSAAHVTTLAQRMARDGLVTSSRELEEAADQLDERAEDAAREALARAGARSAFRAVMGYALRHDGAAAVDEYLRAVSGSTPSVLSESELESRWSGWVRAVARQRVQADDDPDDAADPETRFRRAIGEMPAYSQAREQVRARRAAAERERALRRNDGAYLEGEKR